jgi:hypothetical protein
VPYEDAWNPNITESCPKTVTATRFRADGSSYPEEIECPACSGTGERKVGGWVQVWIDPS